MSLCDKIEKAEECAVEMSVNYVTARSKGRASDEMLQEVLLFNSYIKSLLKYEKNKFNLVSEKVYLTNNGKQLTINGQKLCVSNVTNKCNACLDKSDIEFILEQISLTCPRCKCE